ncbi:hypothetical protein RvY_03065 [Ramazzottius varieornatus]|uniref:Uncharacterized protein n=1 Tax=Ramazzottius varieornatus TaxID=947166 RepID=A0A1D1UWB0_RAMVA|nr:hypothetical protein RvY_03065 [Ramazzottius varieornatus]
MENCRRPSVLTFRNITTNRIQRFFLTVTNFMHEQSQSSIKRLHVHHTLEMPFEGIASKQNECLYKDYLNRTKVLKLHGFPLVEMTHHVGSTYTRYACDVMKGTTVPEPRSTDSGSTTQFMDCSDCRI